MTTVGEITFGDLTCGEMAFGDLIFGEMTFGEVAFVDLTFGEPTGHHYNRANVMMLLLTFVP